MSKMTLRDCSMNKTSGNNRFMEILYLYGDKIRKTNYRIWSYIVMEVFEENYESVGQSRFRKGRSEVSHVLFKKLLHKGGGKGPIFGCDRLYGLFGRSSCLFSENCRHHHPGAEGPKIPFETDRIGKLFFPSCATRDGQFIDRQI